MSQHETFIKLVNEVGLSLLSLGSDGAANERASQASLRKIANTYLRYTNISLGVSVEVPLLGQPPRPIVTVQDPKHGRKTVANQLLSGALLLSFGKYHINIQHLATMLSGENSPLYQKDIFDTDKQDDGRAYRVFNVHTLEASLAREECMGLSIYLYICGEMCDAWLNQEIGHLERIQAVWTAAFFLQRWHAYLVHRQNQPNSLMSVHSNFISHQSYNIFLHMANSLIGLIISHCEYHSEYRLHPWKHGTEAVEHIFGWMRVVMPNFTVLDARQMMPKIFELVKSIMSGRVQMPKSEHMHSGMYKILSHVVLISDGLKVCICIIIGYEHSFSEETVAQNTQSLSYFPSNAEIDSELAIAKSQADSLAQLAGMGQLESENNFPLQDAFTGPSQSKNSPDQCEEETDLDAGE